MTSVAYRKLKISTVIRTLKVCHLCVFMAMTEPSMHEMSSPCQPASFSLFEDLAFPVQIPTIFHKSAGGQSAEPWFKILTCTHVE